jgi:hypothetical protein
MTRKSFSYHHEMLARFAQLMQLRKLPDVEAFKIRIPVDPSQCEESESQRSDDAKADDQ